MGFAQASSVEGYQAFLKLIPHIYHYSPLNQIRIFGQDPQATMVNSYERWKESGRQVRKGERGIRIYYPQFRTIEIDNPQTGQVEPQRVLSGFGIGNVFDVRQTEGPDLVLPEPSINFSTTDGAVELDKRVALFGIGKGVVFEKRKLPEQIRGVFQIRENRVVLNDQLANDDGKIKTLTHEMIHAMEYAKYGLEGRDLSEVIAEGGANAFLGYHGIETSGYSFPYMVRYAFDPDVMKLALPRIAAVTKELITGVEAELPEQAGEWL